MMVYLQLQILLKSIRSELNKKQSCKIAERTLKIILIWAIPNIRKKGKKFNRNKHIYLSEFCIYNYNDILNIDTHKK